MLPPDFLKAANILLSSSSGRPTGVCLRRAESSAYYALFHCLARECADLLIGGNNAKRSDEAWRQVYRALERGIAKDRCKNKAAIKKFPTEIKDFAQAFVEMQEIRHEADYDPHRRFMESEVKADIFMVQSVLKAFKQTRAEDRRAFCAWVLVRDRRG